MRGAARPAPVASRLRPKRKESAIYQLLAIAYPEQYLAAEAADELDRRAWDLLMDSDAASTAVCDTGGNIRHADGRPMPTAPGWKDLWPALLASVREGEEPDGIEGGFRDWLRGVLRPDTSVIAAVIETSRHAELLEVLMPLGGMSITSPLPADFLRRWGIPEADSMAGADRA